MISVLIPVYNYDVSILVNEIHKQSILENIDFEIICIDDCSTIVYDKNLELTTLNNVKLIQLKENIGRSKIRNLLALKAKFEWLLFLDADVMPETQFFIKTYLTEIKCSNEKVFCGGILYEDKLPEKNHFLRWYYGRNREVVDCRIRQKKPYDFFLGANFLIHKKVFDTVLFNEIIVEYGYEDTLFVQDLRVNNVSLKQVESRVFHLGLERNDIFLNKTKVALQNLKKLNEQNLLNVEYIKVLRVFKNLKRTRQIFIFVWKKFNKKMEENLNRQKPSMYLFDIYKLSYFCYINR